MEAWIAVGGPRPPGSAGPGGWDWWTLVGVIAVFLFLRTSWRRPPLIASVSIAVVGGLVIGELTEAWGVTPVWGSLVLVVLSRNILRRTRPREV